MAKKIKEEKPKKAKGLWAKIFAVQQDAGNVKMLGINEFQNYTYAKEKDYLEDIKPLLGKNNLLILQEVVEHEERDVVTQSGKTEHLVNIAVDFTIIDIETEENITLPFRGSGQDATDKALPKAHTMANKYFLAKTFLIETIEDPDTEARKGKGKGQDATDKRTPSPIDMEKVKKMIKTSTEAGKLIDAAENIKNSTNYTPAQKKELNLLISHRVDEINNQK